MADAIQDVGGGALQGASFGGSIGGGYGALAGGIIGAAGGLLGYLVQSGKEQDAQAIIARAQAAYGSVTAQSIMNASKDVLGATELAKIQADPKLQQAQDDVLASLKNIADTGGMTVQARTQFNDAQAAGNRQAQNIRQSNLQDMQSRGLNTSGASIGLAAAGEQNAANMTAHAGVQALGDAQLRALQAIAQRGQLAGNMQQAQYARDSQRATAQDMINELNWGNREGQYANARAAAAQQYQNALQQAGFTNQQGQNQATAIEGGAKALGQGAIGLDRVPPKNPAAITTQPGDTSDLDFSSVGTEQKPAPASNWGDYDTNYKGLV